MRGGRRGAAISMEPLELWVTDGGYQNPAEHIFTRFIKDANNNYVMRRSEVEDNDLISHERAGSEHGIEMLVRSHELWRGRKLRMDMYTTIAYMDLTVHTTALMIRMEPSRQRPGFGYWSHFPTGYS